MPFSPGELCCVNTACVLLDVNTGSEAESWDLIPHVSNISFSLTANTPKLVTSSTGGKETSACGTVTQNGQLEIACHGGDAPGLLTVNSVYHIRWARNCDWIWDRDTCAAKDVNSLTYDTPYFEAFIRITTMPMNMNIAGNQAIIMSYSFDIVSWVSSGDPEIWKQPSEEGISDAFVHCD